LGYDATLRHRGPSRQTQRATSKAVRQRGLFLLVTPAGGKLWLFKYPFADKEKLIALRKYPEITLKEARVRSDDAHKLLAHAIDPGEQRKLSGNTFEVVARRWYALQKASLVESFAIEVIRSLEADALPTIGARSINDIKPPEVLAMLRKVEARGALGRLTYLYSTDPNGQRHRHLPRPDDQQAKILDAIGLSFPLTAKADKRAV
jgi:hypothetical protein